MSEVKEQWVSDPLAQASQHSKDPPDGQTLRQVLVQAAAGIYGWGWQWVKHHHLSERFCNLLTRVINRNEMRIVPRNLSN